MTKRHNFFLLTVLLLQACDCFVSVKGKVISNTTKRPIKDLIIEMVDKSESTKSDENGYFSLSNHVGFCFDPQIKITKSNHKPFEMTFGGSRESKSYKVTTKQDFIDYAEPLYTDPNDKSTFILENGLKGIVSFLMLVLIPFCFT